MLKLKPTFLLAATAAWLALGGPSTSLRADPPPDFGHKVDAIPNVGRERQDLFGRDLGADQFLGSALQFPTPPTGGELASATEGMGAGPTQLASLDPQLDTSGALSGSLSSSSSAGTTLHANFHAQQAADLAAFQANQAATHNNLHTQVTNAHATFHNVFGGNPGFGALHGSFHAQQGQIHGNFHSQQATALAAEQAQQDADHTDFHTQNGIP